MLDNFFEIKTADPLGILKATAEVLHKAKFVSLDLTKIPQIMFGLKKALGKERSSALTHFGFFDQSERGAQLLLVEDAINFCYWPNLGEKKWRIEYPSGNFTNGGWLTMTACFTRALEEGKPLWEANYLKNLTIRELAEFFRSCNRTKIPLLEERAKCLNEVGRVLLEKYNGEFKNLIKKAGGGAIKLINIIIQDFPSFRDIAKLNGQKIPFLKRAQILAYDLNWMFDSKALGKLSHLDELTAFADYKIPQMLRRLGVIKYSKDLAEKIDNFVLLKAGSREEIEIRAATIWGVELLRQQIPGSTAGQIDSALWEISQNPETQEKPYHRTRTIYY